MNDLSEFPVDAASQAVAINRALPPGGETETLGRGQDHLDAPFSRASAEDDLLDPAGHADLDAPACRASRVEKPDETTDRGGQYYADAQRGGAAPVGDACERLQELQVRRRFWIKTITRQDNALGALARRAMGWRYDMPEAEREKMNGKAAALVSALLKGKEVKADDAAVASALLPDIVAARAARDPMVDQRHQIELEMKRVARTLHVAEWQKSVRGFGPMGLPVIVGEAGDLSNYANPAKLWRRLGLAPYQGHAGKTWRIETWRPRSLSAAEWSDYGYSAQRLAQVYGVVTEPLMKGCGGTVYRAVYDHAKASFADRATSPAHAHAHAMRLMTKALVLDLWRVWHGMPPRERAFTGDPDA